MTSESHDAPRTGDDVHGYVAPSLPREVEVGGEPMVLRRMTPADADRLHTFFLGLPASDLLFLRRDVTTGREINEWVREVERGDTVTLIAESGGTVMGEATIHLSGVPWTRHVGVVRVFTAYEQRGRGLGRLLLSEAMHLAPSLGIEKVLAEATVEQVAARRLLEELGFVEAAVLKDWVRDRHGKRHNLAMLVCDVSDPDLAPLDAVDGRAAWRCSACGAVTHAPEPPNHCADCGAGAGFLLRLNEE